MEMKDYIIQLNNDDYGWSFLWNVTIQELKKVSTRVEIISCTIPTVVIRTDKNGYFLIHNLDGIKNIKEDESGYLI